MNCDMGSLMAEMEKVMADFEQLKGSIFRMMDKSIRDAFISKDRGEKMQFMGKYKVLDELMRENGLYEEYVAWGDVTE